MSDDVPNPPKPTTIQKSGMPRIDEDIKSPRWLAIILGGGMLALSCIIMIWLFMVAGHG